MRVLLCDCVERFRTSHVCNRRSFQFVITIQSSYCLMHLPSLTQTLKMLSPHVMSPDKYKGFNSGLPAVFKPPMWHKYLIARKSATMPHPPPIEAQNNRSRAPRMLGQQYRSFVSVYLVNVSHACIMNLSCIIHYSSCCSCLRGECSNKAAAESACETKAAYVDILVCAVIHR